MSSKCDLWNKDRLRFYFEWNDQSLRLDCFDPDFCHTDDFSFVLPAKDWRDFAEAIIRALDNYEQLLCTPEPK